MIVLRAPPVIRPARDGGWEIMFLPEEVPDLDNIPFRRILAEIVELLGGPEQASVELPPEQEWEDFIEGLLIFQGRPLAIYWEQILACLDLRSEDREALEDAAARIFPGVTVTHW